MKLVILILLITSIITNAQNYWENYQIAADPAINEIEPYLTRNWYDGWISHGDEETIATLNNVEPLWLIYIETDFADFYQVAAYNFSFDYNKNISVSKKQVIAKSNGKIKSKPIIENFMGKPVAIWHEGDSSQFDLYYSVLYDSTWSTPQNITNDLENEYSVNFVTKDSWELSSQNNRFNYLVRDSGNKIILTELDTTFNWLDDKILYSSMDSITEITSLFSSKGQFWIVFTELGTQDTSYIKAFVQEHDSVSWKGPFVIKKLDNIPLYGQLNLAEEYFYNRDLIEFEWVEDSTFIRSVFFLQNDSLKFESENPDSLYFDQIDLIASNTLLTGGCVIVPAPYYFTYTNANSAKNLSLSMISPEYVLSEWSSNGKVTNLALSGMNKQSVISAWSETHREQSDLYVRFNYVVFGDVKNNNNDRTFILSQNYPNPFNPTTTIKYEIPTPPRPSPSQGEGVREGLFVSLKIYDILGREVSTLVNKKQAPGNYQVTFNGGNLPSGVYFYRLKTNGFSKSKKMLLIR